MWMVKKIKVINAGWFQWPASGSDIGKYMRKSLGKFERTVCKKIVLLWDKSPWGG